MVTLMSRKKLEAMLDFAYREREKEKGRGEKMQEKGRSQNKTQLPARMHTSLSSLPGSGVGLAVVTTGFYSRKGVFISETY